MAQLSGLFRLGDNAELRYTPNGDAVASLSLAYNYGRKGEDGKAPTQWINASLWGKRAEATAPHLLKGGQIYAEVSDIHIETYAKKDGGEGFKLVGRIAELEFAGGRPAESDRSPPADNRAPAQNKPAPAFDDLDDSIPFIFNVCSVSDMMGLPKSMRRARRGESVHCLFDKQAD
jgi:single-strand DNA-binding protein